MSEPSSGLVTLLFTDIVGSTELLSRTGDTEAQRLFSAHHQLLAEAVTEYGGHEVKWLGDGLMVAFSSAADALACAIAMQQRAQRPLGGERMAIRVGLTAGEALRDMADYFGTPVVMAKRLCDRAEAGQILCSDLVAGLLAGRPGFTFAAVGELELKGLPQPVATYEVRYEVDPAGPFVSTPLVGRDAEMARLSERLSELAGGRGGLVLVAGEPGIGKTRLAEEVAAQAERAGAFVLWGRCFEGEWAPPYAPFAEALEPHVAVAVPEELREDLEGAAGPLVALVPRIRDILPDIPDALPVPPEEERFRLLDAMVRFLVARSRRAPVLLVLDDLQWADRSTVAMIRHLVRFTPRERILLLGAFPDMELAADHPLTDLLGVVAREAGYERLDLKGLDSTDVTRLLGALGGHEVEAAVGEAWLRQTEGNPFFIHELVRHLIEEGSLYQGPDGRWNTTKPLAHLGVPQRVRDVISRRLARLSKGAHQFLQAASAFDGPFRFDVVATMAELSELDALDALDEALAPRLVAPAGPAETYVFLRTLIRQTVYRELSPSRQVRLHRRAAEALAALGGPDPTPAHAGEIAVQYYRSRSLPGAERGVEPALRAAEHSQRRGAYDEAAVLLRMALDLLVPGDERRPRLLARLAIVLAWALAFDDALATARAAGEAIVEGEGKAAAAEFLSDAAYVLAVAGGVVPAWEVARQGLAFAEGRDVAWARLFSFDQERVAAEDPEHPGIPLDSAERREAARILREAHLDPLGPAPSEAVFDDRDDALESTNLVVLTLWAGEYAHCRPRLEQEAEESRSLGRLARAARAMANLAYCHVALGRLDDARVAVDDAVALAARVGQPIFPVLYAQELLAMALDEGWEELYPIYRTLSASTAPALSWALGYIYATTARMAARLGEPEEALRLLGRLVPWIERAPAWTLGAPVMCCEAAELLWALGRLDHADVILEALQHKILATGFRHPMMEPRLALARMSALAGDLAGATSWFTEARSVLTEQGARSLLAICDFDEAVMHVRAGGDTGRAGSLLAGARRQFEEIGMTGWIRRAGELRI